MSWLPKQTVIVPIDFSESSKKAVDEALQLVADPSHLHIIHVLSPISISEPGVVWGAVDDNSRRDHALAAMKERYADPRYKCMVMTVEIGSNAAREVAAYAERQKADLIVVPCHGRGGAAQALIGSVTERIVRNAKCRVLVLRDHCD